MQRYAIDSSRHAMLADPPMNIAPGIGRWSNFRRRCDLGVVRGREIGRTRDELGHGFCQNFKHALGCLAGGDEGRVLGKLALQIRHHLAERGRQIAAQTALEPSALL